MSKDLKKGDWVIANGKFLSYLFTASDGTHWGAHEGGGHFSFDTYQIPNRKDVDDYIKGKGWERQPLFRYDKENQFYEVRRIGKDWALWMPTELLPNNFDNATTQLAEAILVARLLNATSGDSPAGTSNETKK